MKKTIILTLSLYLFLNTLYLFAVPTPEILWQFDMDDSSFGMTAAGDIDGDGRLELVFGCYRNDDHIYALNAEDGSLLWKYNATLDAPDGCNDVAPILFDIDGDGILEVIVPSSCNAIVTCFNGKDGAVIWQSKTKGSDSPPTIADIDNDGLQEILFGEFGGYVICFDVLTGEQEWEILVDKNSWIQTAPSIADFDGDKLPEIFFIGGKTDYPDVSKNFGRGYCLSLKSGTGPDWLMFQNNIRRTGNICDNTTDVEEALPKNEIIITPNPASEYIEIKNWDKGLQPLVQNIEIKIFNTFGELVLSDVQHLEDVGHLKRFDISHLPVGIYFIKVGNYSKKFVVLR